MARGKPLTYTLFIGDKQVDKLPEDYLDKMADRLGKVMSVYYSNHMDEYVKIQDVPPIPEHRRGGSKNV